MPIDPNIVSTAVMVKNATMRTKMTFKLASIHGFLYFVIAASDRIFNSFALD